MKRIPCPECHGSGEVDEGDEFGTLLCSDCDGTGEIEVEDPPESEDVLRT